MFSNSKFSKMIFSAVLVMGISSLAFAEDKKDEGKGGPRGGGGASHSSAPRGNSGGGGGRTAPTHTSTPRPTPSRTVTQRPTTPTRTTPTRTVPNRTVSNPTRTSPSRTVNNPTRTTPNRTVPNRTTPTRTNPTTVHNNNPTHVNNGNGRQVNNGNGRQVNNGNGRQVSNGGNRGNNNGNGRQVNNGGRNHVTVQNHHGDTVVVHNRTYVQNTVNHGGREYLQRSYNGHNRYYGDARWGRHDFIGYHHSFDRGYFWPSWGGRRWGYSYASWGWATAAWFGAYSWYWHPYWSTAGYIGPDYFVTDYVVSSYLSDSYANGYRAGAADANAQAAISQADQDQLRNQVDQTSQAFKSDQTVGLQDAFNDPNYLFAVTDNFSAGACNFGSGDLLKVAQAPDPDGNETYATMVVVSSANGCQVGTQVPVPLDTLQAMLNGFAEKVDDGMAKLQQSQGQ